MKEFKLYYSDTREKKENVFYPHSITIRGLDDLRKVVVYDHVAAQYKNNHRKHENFIQSNCTIFDLDNSETDYPEKWLTPEAVKKYFPNVPFYVSYSRNHMKQKGDKAPRPKFHVYFPDVTIDDSEEEKRYKEKVCNYFPHFDQNAKDAARFFFGVENPKVEFYNGDVCLSDFMKSIEITPNTKDESSPDLDLQPNFIPSGTRNTSMHKFACRVLVRYGDTSLDIAFQEFLQESKKCRPLLPDGELSSIWKSALKFYHEKVQNDPNYVNPRPYETQICNNQVLDIVDKNALNSLILTEPKHRKFGIYEARLFLKAFGITIRQNDMNRRIEITGLPAKYSGEDAHSLLVTIISNYANALSYKRATSAVVFDTLHVIACDNHYHPVLELLSLEPWDKIDRLTDLYSMMGLTDEFHKTLVKKWALQTIAILYNSEEKPITAQGILVLQGKQGIGKTELFRHLAIKSNFFKGGATLDMKNKDSLMSATKVWLCELGEIDSTTKKEQSALKAFLTEHMDRFREPYARVETIRPRRTAFCGTVNPKWYLCDVTGNRRFWTIPIESININEVFEHSSEWYTQFWRQIQEEYKNNPKSYLLSHEEQDKINSYNTEYEVEIYGEDEFMNTFNTKADRCSWKNLSASEIANILNERYRGLNIKSENIGRRLIPKIEKRIGREIDRKTVNGKRYYMCPPLSTYDSERQCAEFLLDYQEVIGEKAEMKSSDDCEDVEF